MSCPLVRSRLRSFAVAVCAAAPLLVSKASHAGGYFIGPIGGQASGRAGAFVAKASDLSAAYYNPAGFALVSGTRLQLDNKFSYNTFEFQREPAVDTTGVPVSFAPSIGAPQFQPLDPLLGVSTDFGLRDFAFALVAYANSGTSSLEFPLDGGQRYMMTKREGQFINYSANVAYRVTPRLALGLNAQVVAVPQLSYQLVVNGADNAIIPGLSPVRNDRDLLATVEGKDLFTLNAIVGAWYQVAPELEIGLSAQVIPSSIVTQGPISLRFVNPNTAAQINAGLDPITTRNGQAANDVSIELPLPLWAKVGTRYVGRNATGIVAFDVELDVTYEQWSRVDEFTVRTNDLMAQVGPGDVPLGTIAVPKQWQDVLAFNLGADYVAIPDALTVRAGAYYETAVAKPEFSNVDFATGQQFGATCGATIEAGGFSISAAYEYRTQPQVSTSAASGQVTQVIPLLPTERVVVNGGTYRAQAHSGVLGLGYKF